jgi:hypothetical protein
MGARGFIPGAKADAADGHVFTQKKMLLFMSSSENLKSNRCTLSRIAAFH